MTSWSIAPNVAIPSRARPSSATSRAATEWARSASDLFSVKLVIRTDDRPGLLNQLTSILSTEDTNIRSLEARTDAEHGDGAIIEMTVEVRDKKQLEKLVLAMRRISGVRDVERLLS